MRFMVIIRATKDTEAGKLPDEKVLAAMGAYNEELVKAGVMLGGEGLHPSSRGKLVHFSAGKPRIVDGPFAEAKELIAGYWLWQVRSVEECLAWVRRIPNPHGEDFDVEIRQVFEADEFGPEFTPELRAQEESQRARIEERQKGARK